MFRFCFVLLFLVSPVPALALEVRTFSEFFRTEPGGGLLRVDWSGAPHPQLVEIGPSSRLRAPRNGYISFHLAAIDPDGGDFTLTSESSRSDLEVDLFREWFHRNPREGSCAPDALIPVNSGAAFSIPDPEMGIPHQKAALFWVDVWVPRDATPGPASLRFHVRSPSAQESVAVNLDVLDVVIPKDDGIVADHNSYGLGWVSRYFPGVRQSPVVSNDGAGGSDAVFEALHTTYRLLYEHRGLLHNLGYSHSGGVDAGFAPELMGEGVGKRVSSWEVFDRHFGPLLDGSAFEGTRRGARPIEFVYLTINPEWPAQYLGWGTDAYEAEFVGVVGEMEKHFREKGWLQTNFEMFFNHKKRYKGFEWDGDETRFPKDNTAFKEFARLLYAAVPADSPVSFVFRHDASWLMRQQMEELKGVVNFWVCGAGVLAFYPEVPGMLRSRGDMVWIYGGTPSHFESTAAVLDLPVDAWMRGLGGFVRWLTTAPGEDPWFHSDGGRTALFYPGDRFGLAQPLACIRLKIQRNCLQDIALLRYLESREEGSGLREAVASLAAGAAPADWWNEKAPVKNLDPWEWSNASLGKAEKPPVREARQLDGRWWMAVRSMLMDRASVYSRPPDGRSFRKPHTERVLHAAYRPDIKLDPHLPTETIKGGFLDQLDALARIASQHIRGDDSRTIVTDRAEHWLFQRHPDDPWFAMDNYDVNPEPFIRIKKELIRIGRLAGFPVDCNLWLRTRARPEKVHAVIRQVHGWSQWYEFGQMTIDPSEEMLRTLGGQTVRVQNRKPGLTSVLAPVKAHSGETVGFVEVCALNGGR